MAGSKKKESLEAERPTPSSHAHRTYCVFPPYASRLFARLRISRTPCRPASTSTRSSALKTRSSKWPGETWRAL
jgi:hypothetical protein